MKDTDALNSWSGPDANEPVDEILIRGLWEFVERGGRIREIYHWENGVRHLVRNPRGRGSAPTG